MSKEDTQNQITVRELKPSLWNDLAKLFGEKGACGGCWCMFWRHPLGEKWTEVKGVENKKRFKKLVESGKAHGAIAYENGNPIGWVSFDKRGDYLKLDRAPSLSCSDADQVWSIPCFYIHSKSRGKSVGSKLLKKAMETIQKLGGKIIEGYPVRPTKNMKQIPAAFAHTGLKTMFLNENFEVVGNKGGGRERMRLSSL